MLGFDARDHLEEDCSFLVALFLGGDGELGVHAGRFVVLSADSLLEVCGGVTELARKDELVLGVPHLVDRGLLEDLRDVVVTLLAGHLGEVGIHVARLALAGKRGHQVFLGLGHSFSFT
jgi:hypothetical protein